MPKRWGGMQDGFVEITARSMTTVERAIASVEKLGGRVTHVYPPNVLITSLPADRIEELRSRRGVVSVTTGPFSARAMKAAAQPAFQEAMAAWNEHVSVDRELRALTAPDLGRAWDETAEMPDPPPDVQERIRRREERLIPRGRATGRAPAAGAPIMSIPVLVGRVAVGVVFVDSTVSQYAVANSEKSKVISETAEGLNMLAGFEPKAGVQWFYNFKRPKISLGSGSFPAGDEDEWENTWRNAAMASMGYSASITGMKAYINKIKTDYGAQWAYALFVTKYPKDWFAYYWANHVVMDFAVDGWGIDNFSRVVAHETGHVFGCPDEYSASGCNCTSKYGRYQVVNGNCDPCAVSPIPCLMKANTPAVCDYTRGHLGWNELSVQSRGTTVLKGTWTFDFDTGVQGPPTGSDIWWEQIDTVRRLFVPEGGATLAHMGKPNFDAVSRQTLQTQPYTATPIDGSNNASNRLTAGTVVAIKTGAGRFTKMRVDAYGYNLGITWVTFK